MPRVWVMGLLLAVSLLVYWLYLPGLQGSLHFDDEVNLRGLDKVSDWESALHFSLGGWNLLGEVSPWPLLPPRRMSGITIFKTCCGSMC